MTKMTKMNRSILNSPSKRIAAVLILALGVGLSAALSDPPTEQHNRSDQQWDTSTARRSQNVEIASTFPTDFPTQISTSIDIQPQPPPSTIDISEPSFQFVIQSCGSQAGNANLRVGSDVIGIISAGTVVELTGNVSGDWIEVFGPYWPTGADHPTTGPGWVHNCWLSPEVMVIPDPSLESEPLGLLSRRRARRSSGELSRTGSRPSPGKRYVQSTEELAGYVGRDIYDYALLYLRIAAYQSFWNFATEGPQRTYQPQPPIPRTDQSIPPQPQVQSIEIVQPTQVPQPVPIVSSATVPQHCGSVASQFWDWLVAPGPSC